MPSRRPTDRRHTRTSGVSSGPLGAAYRSAHSSTSRAGCEASSGVQVGDSIMTAGNSRTAHSRAILAEHRPMPCYGVVNASMITNKAAPVVQAQDIRTRPGSKCIPSACPDTEASSCVPPGRKRVLTYLGTHRPGSERKLLACTLGSHPKPLLYAAPSDSLSHARDITLRALW